MANTNYQTPPHNFPIEAYRRHYEVIARVIAHCRPLSYLEIGVQEGRSLHAALAAMSANSCPDLTTLVLCDTWDSRHGGTNRGEADGVNNAKSLISQWLDTEYTKLTILSGRSQDTLPKAIDEGRVSSVDISHIDGSHDYTDTHADLRNCWPITSKALILHDASFPNVWQAAVKYFNECECPPAYSYLSFADQGTLVCFRAID